LPLSRRAAARTACDAGREIPDYQPLCLVIFANGIDPTTIGSTVETRTVSVDFKSHGNNFIEVGMIGPAVQLLSSHLKRVAAFLIQDS
jgi:hypothetical protein